MDINLKCSGDNGNIPGPKKPDTLAFKTPANCPLKSFGFVPKDPPPGSGLQRVKTSPNSIEYSYDGTPIPGTGYPFAYTTGGTIGGGNGGGVIK